MTDKKQDTLSPELLGQLNMIQIRARRLARSSASGEYRSAFKGSGMEFDEVRAYQPGDDVRFIDWKVTARMNEPFIKQHREERQMTVILVVDVSGSLDYAGHGQSKRKMAAEIAASIAYLAIGTGDRVGLLLVSREVESYIPPSRGRGHIWRLIRTILCHPPQHKETHLKSAVDFLGRVQRRRASIFVISDLPNSQREAITRFPKQHDVTVLRVFDRHEESMPDVGLIRLHDLESGHAVLLDTSTAKIVNHHPREGGDPFIDQIDVPTDGTVLTPLLKLFAQHQHRHVRGNYGSR